MPLNLLPPEYRRQLAKKNTWLGRRRAIIFLALVVIICTGGMILGQNKLQRQTQTLQDRIDQLKREQAVTPTADITTVTDKINTTTSSLIKTLGTARSWTRDLQQIISILPEGVTVQDLSLTEAGSITLSGTAVTRSSFIALDTAIKKSPLLTKVETLSTPSKRDNLPFTYTAVLSPSIQP